MILNLIPNRVGFFIFYKQDPLFQIGPNVKKNFWKKLDLLPLVLNGCIFIFMKKIIRLTESDLTRIIKRVINESNRLNEGEEELKKMEDLISQGLDPLKAYYISQIKDGWADILIVKGVGVTGDLQNILTTLFDDPESFYRFFSGISKDETINKFYPKWEMIPWVGFQLQDRVDWGTES
jgi:aryl carrier-like protein